MSLLRRNQTPNASFFLPQRLRGKMLDIKGLLFLQKVCQSVVKCKERCTSGESRSRWDKNVHLLSSLAKMRPEKPNPAWSWIWQGMWTATRRDSTSTWTAKSREGVSALLIRAGKLWQMTQKRHSVFSVTWSLSIKGILQESQEPQTRQRGKFGTKKLLHSMKEVKLRALKQTGFTKSFAS